MSGHDLLYESIELSNASKSHRSSDRLIQTITEEQTDESTQDHELRGHDREIESKRARKGRGLFQGWRFTLFLAFTASVVVLLFNIVFLIFTTVRAQQGQDVALSRGDCEQVHRLSVGFHWIINALSTILLAASNFGMQCLVAPTRNDIDRAHQKHKWIDIGVPSLRNLFSVSSGRSILWIFLFFSSIPLHVFYNSAIFYQTAVPAYNIFAGPDFLAQKNSSKAERQYLNSTERDSFKRLFRAAQDGNLKRLDGSDCVTAFAQTYQTAYSNVVLVTEDDPWQGSYALVDSNSVYDPKSEYSPNAISAYPWLCSANVKLSDCEKEGSSVTYNRAAKNNWTVNAQYRNAKVRYCLAEPAPQRCSLQYSVPLTLATVLCNVVKACILLYLWIGVKEAPILTVGDAIVSFLCCPDPYSKGMCLPSDGTGIYIPPIHAVPHALQNSQFRHPVAFTDKRNRWGSAISSRWGFFIFFWIVAIIICIALMAISIAGIKSGGLDKLGAISSQTILSVQNSGESLIANAFIANLPQLIFSFLYVAYNSLLTSMCLSAEWSSFGNNRKGLRVSHSPRLAQRSNYFLSIPYRFATPLIIVSGILHWLASSGLFVVAIEAYNTDLQRDPANDLFACGYSPVAIISGVCIATTMFIFLIVLSSRRFESAIPVAASCSLAIAAACHPLYNPNVDSAEAEAGMEGHGGYGMETEQEDEEMALLPVKWGSIPVDGPVGHCSFTSVDVYPPETGKEYQ